MFILGLIIGIAVGTGFHAAIYKYYSKAKNLSKEIKSDVEKEFSNK